jgi:hypothetical protein
MIVMERLLRKTVDYSPFVYIDKETPTLFRFVAPGPWPPGEEGPEIPDHFKSEAAAQEFAAGYLTFRAAHGWVIDQGQSVG